MKDSFTGTTGTTLASHTADTGQSWAVDLGTGTLQLTASGKLRFGTHATVIYSIPTSFADGSVFCDFTMLSSLDIRHSIMARWNGSTDLVMAECSHGNNQWQLSEFVGGSQTVLGTAALDKTVNLVQRAELRLSGTNAKLFVNGSQLINVTTTNSASGKMGLFCSQVDTQTDTTGWVLDNYSGPTDEFAGGGGGSAVASAYFRRLMMAAARGVC